MIDGLIDGLKCEEWNKTDSDTYLDETGGYAGARGDHCLHATVVDHKIAH